MLGKNNEQCGYPCPIEGERSGVARAALRVLPLVPADTALKTVCTKSTFGAGFGRTTFLGARLFRLSRQAMRAPELTDGL
ncbi:MAG: hypothetical protein CR217_17845 [Beijerinckiaceae bacterium]|nr:MAG: hypothetical protein CR217_17845 [Beijerinckiaceae bacterium]